MTLIFVPSKRDPVLSNNYDSNESEVSRFINTSDFRNDIKNLTKEELAERWNR